MYSICLTLESLNLKLKINGIARRYKASWQKSNHELIYYNNLRRNTSVFGCFIFDGLSGRLTGFAEHPFAEIPAEPFIGYRDPGAMRINTEHLLHPPLRITGISDISMTVIIFF